ncbi:metallophosphoesterase family protein [Haloarchaeobius sp. DFWS5]|uniref:metallophosphoesterase family protein n=1 Tax=Haloarchaeobius sp. DFWS5 TaxID=3446114 RepID=UPI003EBE9E15
MQTIGLLYDLHISIGRFPHEDEHVQHAAIDKLNEVGVDWTLAGGDLRLISPWEDATQWGEWHGDPDDAYYHSEFGKAKRLLDERLDSDYHVIRGNNERPLSAYRKHFPAEDHPLWFHFEEDGARYVFLDSNPHDGTHPLTEIQNFVTAPQISMLERLMDEDPDIPTFVFCHAPLCKHTELDENWETRSKPYFFVLNYQTVQSVLSRGNTVLVNTGHYYYDHGRGSKVENGIEFVLSRHLSHMSEESDYGGDVRWMNVDTENNYAEVRYYDVGEDEEGQLTETTW